MVVHNGTFVSCLAWLRVGFNVVIISCSGENSRLFWNKCVFTSRQSLAMLIQSRLYETTLNNINQEPTVYSLLRILYSLLIIVYSLSLSFILIVNLIIFL
jgi:hypothetical protein